MADTCPTQRFEKILLSTDGSEFSEGAVREAIRLAKKCSGRLSALSVVETNPEIATLAPQVIEKAGKAAREHLAAVQKSAKSESVECDCIVREGEEPYRSVCDEAAKSKCSMIVMGRRGRTGLKKLMMGSVTARVIGHSPCSVLVVPRAARPEYKNIVVATDGSRFSQAAAAEAVEVAKRYGSALTAVSVVPAEFLTPTDIELTMNQQELIAQQQMQVAEKNAKAVKDLAQQAGVSVRAFVLTGRPSDAIIQTAQEQKADLIVLGSHGRTGVERLLMGSVAERVIVLSTCAVLVVKTGA